MTRLFGLNRNIWFAENPEDSMWMARSRSDCALYPTVALLVEDLRRQRVALLGTPVFRDVPVHPKPLLLQHGDVHLLEVDSISLQESHHCLLLLLYLEMEREQIISQCYQAFMGGDLSCSITAVDDEIYELRRDKGSEYPA